MDEWVQTLKDAVAAEFAGKPVVGTLATVDDHGAPDARSVVVRAIEGDGTLAITSDARSAKNAQLRDRPLAALVLWLPVRRLQFRLTGPTTIANGTDPRALRVWRSTSPASRATFLWPTPGGPVGPPDAYPKATDRDDPPDAFEMIVLRPTHAESLDLTTHPHARTIRRATDAWTPRPVSP